MDFKKLMSRILSAATATAMLAAGFSVMPAGDSTRIDAGAASDITVDISKEHQLIRGFGGINHPEWTGQDMTNAQLQTAFGNGANELGLTVLRVFVNPDKNQWNKAVPAAKYATEHGAYVFASPWEPPSNLAESGGSKGKLHLPRSNYEAYANHLNDFGTYMKNNGVDLYSISVQNEPDYASEWTYWSTDEATDFVANYGHLITSTRLMSPESFQYSPDGASWISGGDGGKRFYTKIMNNAKAMENCDLFGTHFYGTTRDWMDFPALENSGKEIWMTEVYVPNSEADSANRWPEALDVAENIHNGMVVGNMSAYTWWYIRRSYGLMDESGKITKRGYMMSQFSKWVRPGYIRVDATEKPENDVFVSAYKGGGDKVVIVAVNKGTTEYNKNFTVSGGSISDVDRYRTTGSANLEETADMKYNGSTFNAQIPAQSVSTFVVTLSNASGIPGTGGDEPAEPNEYGWWFQCGFENGDDNWTNRGGNTTAVSSDEHYTEWGSKSLKVSDRTSAWNGAFLALSSSIFKSGEPYSFSAHVKQNSGENVKFMMKLEYTKADGETGYSEIASVTAPSGTWAQLTNKSYTIPEGATDLKIYIETEESLTDFYIDEAIGAVDGTGVAGEGQPELPTDPSDFIPGDVDGDGSVSAYDMAAMRSGVINGFADSRAEYAANVNADDEVNVADLVILSEYLLGKDVQLKKAEIKLPEVSQKMRTISVYTPLVQVSEFETADSKTEKAGVNYGTLEKKSYYSNFCGRNKSYNVLLPANYDKSKKYPVLYVMHGYWENQDRMILTGNGTMSTQQIIGNAIAEGAAKEMIVVFPYIYSSKTQDNCSAMDDANNQAYDNFDTVLTTELMPLIEKEYSVATGRENTAITGFSMGGRESLMIGMKHPDLFGYVGAICAAPGATGAFKFASEEAAPSLIFLTAGSNDTVVYTTPEGYHNNFTSNSVPHIWHYVNGGYHGDNSIHAHIYNFVRAIFKA